MAVALPELQSRLTDRVALLCETFTVPGVALSADIAGELVEAHHGVTHVDHPLPVNGDTMFQIASMSKPFAATLAMMLVAQGSVNLDDPVVDSVPDFRTLEPEQTNQITLRHLLTHTTGWDGDELLVRPAPGGTLADAPDVMASARHLVDPGTDFTYNNGGFAIAGRLIENVAGRSYADLLRSEVLDPLGLDHTAVDADGAILHRVAMRHIPEDGKAMPLYEPSWQPGWGLAPIDLPVGGIISTTNDLLSWLHCWLRPSADDSLSLNPTARHDMCLPHANWFNPTTSQGIGWALKKYDTGVVHGHGGLTAGYCSYSMFCPALDLSAAVLTNSTTGTALCRMIIDDLLSYVAGTDISGPKPLNPAPDLSRYEGSYTGSFGVITVTDDGGVIKLDTTRHPTAEGEWQPLPEPPRTAAMYSPDHAIVLTPESGEGGLIDFAPGSGRPLWLRSGGRIHTRV